MSKSIPHRPPHILLVDDHAVFRHGLRSILQREFRDAFFAEAGSAEEAVQLLRRNWDLATVDITLPGASGLELLQQMKMRQPKLQVLILSGHREEQYALRALRAGAGGYISKVRAAHEILEAVKQVLAGEIYLSPAIGKQILQQVSGRPQPSLHERLSQREFEVMRLIATGNSGKEIASQLHVSIQTVSTHRANILRKMGFRSSAQVIRYALEHRLIE